MASSLQLAQLPHAHHHVVSSSRRPLDAARRHRCSIAPHTTLWPSQIAAAAGRGVVQQHTPHGIIACVAAAAGSALQQHHTPQRHAHHSDAHPPPPPPQQQQQQHQQQQQQRPYEYVHLLQRAAGVGSWAAAAGLLEERHDQLEAAHVALLWRQLTPRLAHAVRPSQQQQHVLQQLCDLTARCAQQLTPPGLATALKGSAAAAAAAADMEAAMQGGRHLQRLLGQQLVRVAGSCSAPQLAVCLHSAQLLEQQLQASSSGTSSSSSGLGSAWPVLRAASRGLLGQQLQQAGGISALEAAQLLHAVAACVTVHDSNAAQQQEEEDEDEDGTLCIIDSLAAAACGVLAQPAASSSSSSNADESVTVVTFQPLHMQVGGQAPRAGPLYNSSHGSDISSSSDAQLQAAVCTLQALAVLQHLPRPATLEQVLVQLEPHMAPHALPAQSVLQLLQALANLEVEPWPEWLQAAHARLSTGLQELAPGEHVQLLALLPQFTNRQPSPELVHGLARMTAAHARRLSWRQLVHLPGWFRQLRFRPQPYWLKDYTAACVAALQQQRQEQQAQQQAATVDELVAVLCGVAWLSPSASPPPAWLAAIEQALLLQACVPSVATATAAVSQNSGALSPAAAAAVLRACTQWHYTPCSELGLLLHAASGQQSSSSTSGSPPAASSSSTPAADAPEAAAAAASGLPHLGGDDGAGSTDGSLAWHSLDTAAAAEELERRRGGGHAGGELAEAAAQRGRQQHWSRQRRQLLEVLVQQQRGAGRVLARRRSKAPDQSLVQLRTSYDAGVARDMLINPPFAQRIAALCL